MITDETTTTNNSQPLSSANTGKNKAKKQKSKERKKKKKLQASEAMATKDIPPVQTNHEIKDSASISSSPIDAQSNIVSNSISPVSDKPRSLSVNTNTQTITPQQGIKNGYIAQKAHELATEVLASIASSGLVADAKEHRLRSYEEKNCDTLSVNVVNFNRPLNRQGEPVQGTGLRNTPTDDEMDSTYHYLVYSATQGAWPISAERNYDTEFDTEEWNERLSTSIFFILKPPVGSHKYLAGDKGLIVNADSSDTKPGLDQAWMFYKILYYSYELQTSQHFLKGDILAIISPKDLVEIVKVNFPSTYIIPVDNRIQGLKLPTLCENRTKVLVQNVEKDQYRDFQGPDYISGLESFIKITGNMQFSCHLSRLPTPRDILVLNQKQLEKADILKFYKTEDIDTALRRAAHQGYKYDVEFLLKLGANINSQDNQDKPEGKRTALHWAVLMKRESVIRLLLKSNAKSDIKDQQGKTADTYAKEKGINFANLLDIEKIRLKEAQNRVIGSMPDLMRGFGISNPASVLAPLAGLIGQQHLQHPVFASVAPRNNIADTNKNSQAVFPKPNFK